MASTTLYKAKLQNIVTQVGKVVSPVFLISTVREKCMFRFPCNKTCSKLINALKQSPETTADLHPRVWGTSFSSPFLISKGAHLLSDYPGANACSALKKGTAKVLCCFNHSTGHKCCQWCHHFMCLKQPCKWAPFLLPSLDLFLLTWVTRFPSTSAGQNDAVCLQLKS